MNQLIRQLRDEPDWDKIARYGLNVIEARVWHKTCCDAADALEKREEDIVKEAFVAGYLADAQHGEHSEKAALIAYKERKA